MRTRFLLVLALLPLVGCSARDDAADRRTIGLSVLTLTNPFFKEIADTMAAEAGQHGYQVIPVSGDEDVAKQDRQVKDFIVRKVDAIVLCPCDSKAIGPVIQEANAAGIPVFTADIANTSKSGKVVAHIASDNVQGGAQAAKLMCQALGGKGKVAIIDEPEVTSVQDRTRGFRTALKTACPNVTIVADVSGGGERAKSSSVMEDILQSHRDLNGVFGINDDSALGASRAIDAAGMSGKIAVIGYDATAEARTAIKAGKMYGDAIQHPDQIGVKTVDAIHAYFTGQKPPPAIAVAVGTFTKADAK